MKRKVIKQGNNTLTVTLPRKWTSKYHLNPGDEVEVEEKGRELSIGTKKSLEEGKTVLKVSGPDKLVAQMISVAYKKGFDEVRVEFDDTNAFKVIKKEVESELLGYEIIDQGKGFCIVKNIAEDLAKEFNTILRKVFLSIIEMSEESLNKIKNKDYDLEEVTLIEKANNKYTNFCKRILNKEGYADYHSSNFIYCIVWELEKIADEYRDICNYLMGKKNASIKKEIFGVYEGVNKMMKLFYDSFYDFEPNKVVEIANSRFKLQKEIKEIWPKAKTEDEKILLHHLAILVIRIYGMTGPLNAMKLL